MSALAPFKTSTAAREVTFQNVEKRLAGGAFSQDRWVPISLDGGASFRAASVEHFCRSVEQNVKNDEE